MGMDISYHPVDVEFVHSRIIPYVTNEKSLDDLHSEIVRITRVRFRATSWSYATLQAEHKLADAQREQNPDEPAIGILMFDSDVQVWGRPFFTAGETPSEVKKTVDQYLAANLDEVDSIVAQQLGLLEEEMEESDFEMLGGRLAEVIKPEPEQDPPSDEDIIEHATWKLNLFQKAFKAIKTGEGFEHDGDKHDPAEFISTNFPLACLEFAAIFQPGWMARGYGWPTYLFSEAKVKKASKLFEQPTDLFSPLIAEVPALGLGLADTIEENYMVGGFIPSNKVSEVQELLESNVEKIHKWATKQGWGEGGAEIYLQGIREALWDAAERGMAFAEASEIYSGPMGIVN